MNFSLLVCKNVCLLVFIYLFVHPENVNEKKNLPNHLRRWKFLDVRIPIWIGDNPNHVSVELPSSRKFVGLLLRWNWFPSCKNPTNLKSWYPCSTKNRLLFAICWSKKSLFYHFTRILQQVFVLIKFNWQGFEWLDFFGSSQIT